MRKTVVFAIAFTVVAVILGGCRTGWPEEELIRVDRGNYKVAMLNPAKIDRAVYNCRFSGGGWFAEIVPAALERNIVLGSTSIEGIPEYPEVVGYQTFGLPEEFEEAIEIGRNPDGTCKMIRIGVGEVLRQPRWVYLDRLVKAYPWQVEERSTAAGPVVRMSQTVPGVYRLEKEFSFLPDRIVSTGKFTNLSAKVISTPVYLHPFFSVIGTRAKPVKYNGDSEFDMDPDRPPYLDVETHWFRPDPDEPEFTDRAARPLALTDGNYLAPGIDVASFRNGWITCGTGVPLISFKCDRPLERMLHWHQNNEVAHTFAVEPGFELRVEPGASGEWSWQYALPTVISEGKDAVNP